MNQLKPIKASKSRDKQSREMSRNKVQKMKKPKGSNKKLSGSSNWKF